jgi:hypothetical protein
MTLATRDHHQPAKVVCSLGRGHAQRTRQANPDLNRRVAVDGKIAESASNHELSRRQFPDAHA